MRKACLNISEIIETIKKLRGEKIRMHVNRGRKRVEKHVGVIESTYPSVFVVALAGAGKQSKLSCSYSDVLCGDVKIFQIDKAVKE